jgi:hypothetical protein
MTLEKIRRSVRYKRTQPPRLVHAVQRLYQPCVTGVVTQITETATFSSALDISPLHMTSAAIRAAAAARRLRGPGRRTSGKVGATSDALAVRLSRVTPSRSPRSGRGALGRGTARISGRGVLRVILRAARGGGVQVGSIVMALSPLRYLAPAPRREGAGQRGGPRSGQEDGVGPPSGRAGVHQFQLRIAYSLPLERVAFRRNRSSGHQFQLRMALLSGRRVAKPGLVRIRTALPAVQEPVDVDRAGWESAVSPAERGTVTGGRTLARMAAPPSSRAPAAW